MNQLPQEAPTEKPDVYAEEIDREGRDVIRVPAHTRVFAVTDELAAVGLLDWSPPVQLKLEKRDDDSGLYDLVARRNDGGLQ